MTLPDVHICVIQPMGYVHSLGFLDQARFFRHQFRRMGATVSLAKNRLRHDAVNFVFGAHLGFDAALRARHTCVFVNLEQLGTGGAAVSPAYLALLGNSAVVDYDAGNVSAYTAHLDDVPLISFAHAPYLAGESLPIEARPIDILFFGSVNRASRAAHQAGRNQRPHGHPAQQPAVWARARRADQAGQGGVQLPLLRECAFRAGAGVPMHVPGYAGDQRAQREHAAAGPVRRHGLLGRQQSTRQLLCRALRHGGVLGPGPKQAERLSQPRRDRAVRRRAGVRLRIPQGAGAAHEPGSLAAHAVAHRFGQGLPARLVQRGRARACATRRGARPGQAAGLAAGRGQRFARPGGVAARQLEHDLRQQRAGACARPPPADEQLPGAAARGWRNADRGALRARQHRLAGPDPRAGDELELVDLLRRLVLVPGLVRLALPRQAAGVPGWRVEGVRRRRRAFHARVADQGGHHAEPRR